MRKEKFKDELYALLVKLMNWETMSSVGLRTWQVSSKVISIKGCIKRGRVSIENFINND